MQFSNDPEHIDFLDFIPGRIFYCLIDLYVEFILSFLAFLFIRCKPRRDNGVMFVVVVTHMVHIATMAKQEIWNTFLTVHKQPFIYCILDSKYIKTRSIEHHISLRIGQLCTYICGGNAQSWKYDQYRTGSADADAALFFTLKWSLHSDP